MYKVLIVYAPDVKVLKDTARRLMKQFNGKEFSTVVKEAAVTTVPDFAAADLIILGSEKSKTGDIHPDFSELQRALGGINLSGRLSGFFAAENDAPVRKFKKILKDSEITIYKQPLICSSREEAKTLENWAGDLISFFKDGLHDYV